MLITSIILDSLISEMRVTISEAISHLIVCLVAARTAHFAWQARKATERSYVQHRSLVIYYNTVLTYAVYAERTFVFTDVY